MEFIATYQHANGTLRHARVTVKRIGLALIKADRMKFDKEQLVGIRLNNESVFPGLPIIRENNRDNY